MTPITRVGSTAVSPVALQNDTLPPVTGSPSMRQPSASERQVSANAHITSGSSGERKFRQSITASGTPRRP